MLSAEQRKIRAQIAHAVSAGNADRARELRHQYKVAKLRAAIDRALTEPPGLTAGERAMLAQAVLSAGDR